MTALDDLRAAQHDDLVLPSDHGLTAFLAEVAVADVLRDRLPRTPLELRHLARVRSAA